MNTGPHREEIMAIGSVATEVPVIPIPKERLLEEDGVPLETDWHRLEMNLLIESVTYYWRHRADYFVGGNMFIYYNEEHARNVDYRGPDFFFVRDSQLNPSRPYWAVWLENYKFPNLIIELTSPSTAEIDRVIKKDIYEKIFKTNNYFIFDPADNHLEGWHLENGSYVELQPDERGWLWCDELGLWLGNWYGKFQGKLNTYLRLFDKEGNLVPLFSEAAELAEKAAAADRQRADALEAELAKLKAQVGQARKNGQN